MTAPTWMLDPERQNIAARAVLGYIATRGLPVLAALASAKDYPPLGPDANHLAAEYLVIAERCAAALEGITR